jgi:hypothetical protein
VLSRHDAFRHRRPIGSFMRHRISIGVDAGLDPEPRRLIRSVSASITFVVALRARAESSFE